MSLSRFFRSPLAFTACASLLIGAPASAQQQRHRPGWPCAGSVDPAYIHTAEATGGVVMLFKGTEVAGAAEEMAASNSHPEVVFRATGQVGQGTYEFPIPVDSTIDSVYFFASMQCLQGVSILQPSGEELRADGAGVDLHQFEAVHLSTVSAPTPGVWRLRVSGQGFYSVIVKAHSELGLSAVKFVAGGARVGRQPKRLEVSINGQASDIAFSFLSMSGVTLENLRLEVEREDDTERTYAGEVTEPVEDFRLAVTGTDSRGFRFERVQKQLAIR